MLSKKIKLNPKVQEALDKNKSIVALESTLISHGLPYPANINVAKESIKAVEDSGSVAATIDLFLSKASCTFGSTLIFFESILFFRFVYNVIIYFFYRFIVEINFSVLAFSI